MTKSNILLTICLVFIGGLFVISIFEISPIWGFLFSPKEASEKVNFVGVVTKEPDIRDSNTRLTILTGKKNVLVTTRRYPEYKYGDELKITGNLKMPTNLEGFNYQGYLAKDGIYSLMYYPRIELTGRNRGKAIFRLIFSFKGKVKRTIEKILPLPEVAILEALTLGEKRSLTEELKEQLNKTGTRHIVAISGMHIIILSNALMFILIGVGFWRGQAFYFTLTLMTLFIIMIGAPASAVRAGIMGGALLLAQKIGRLSDSSRVVIFIATIMLVINPLLLRFDVGFQLSFLAVLGIIHIKPIIDDWLNKILPVSFNDWLKKGKIRKEMKSVAIMTISAQFSTLPILIYNFGRISLISLLSNILIVPAVSYIMGAGLIFSLIVVVLPFLGQILIWPMWFMLAYITKLIEWLSLIPLAAYEISNIHWIWLFGYYILLIGFYIKYNNLRSSTS